MNNKSYFDLDDAGLEGVIGERVQRHRLNLNMSQNELAEKAGVARRTITSVENGQGGTLSTLIRLLRAMDKISLLEDFLKEPELSAEQKKKAKRGKLQQRKYSSRPSESPQSQKLSEWSWGDENFLE
ncbi:MAG: helix-turn-helix domain-containing protein [Akkermansiaceae bacterium]